MKFNIKFSSYIKLVYCYFIKLYKIYKLLLGKLTSLCRSFVLLENKDVLPLYKPTFVTLEIIQALLHIGSAHFLLNF